jgi:hypothetical protein
MERKETLMIGYGQSDKPPGTASHIEYSKRVMADDMVQLMYVFSSSSPLLFSSLSPPFLKLACITSQLPDYLP